MNATQRHNTNTVRICVVGHGSIGSLHVELHANNLIPENIAIVENNSEQHEMLRAQGYTVFNSLQASFTQHYDVYDICLPTYLHKEAIELILSKTNAKIMSEKPLVLNSAEFTSLATSWHLRERLVCAYVERFNDPFISAEQWTHDNEGPYVMRFTRRTKKPTRQDWFSDPKKGGDVILDLAIHDIDASIWFSKSAFDKVISYSRSGESEILQVAFVDGSTAVYETGWDILPDSTEGIINNFSISTPQSSYLYDSKTESIFSHGITQSVLPRFPIAYQREIDASEVLPFSISPSFATMWDIEQVYQVINALQQKRNNE